MKIQRTWFPELGDFGDWVEKSRKELKRKYIITKEESRDTYTGGEHVWFSVQDKGASL